MRFDPSAPQNDCLYEIISSDCLLEAWLNHVEFIDSCLHVSIYMNIRSLFVVAIKYHTVHYVYAIYARPDLTRLYGCSNPKLQIQIWLFRYSLFKKSIFFCFAPMSFDIVATLFTWKYVSPLLLLLIPLPSWLCHFVSVLSPLPPHDQIAFWVKRWAIDSTNEAAA